MTGWLAMLDDHWGWLVFAALLGMGEVAIPGIFLIWVALAAAATGLVALVLPISVPLQLLLFAGLCLLSVWGGRRWYTANPVDWTIRFSTTEPPGWWERSSPWSKRSTMATAGSRWGTASGPAAGRMRRPAPSSG